MTPERLAAANDGPYALAPHLKKLIANVTRRNALMSDAMRQQLAAYVVLRKDAP